MFCQLTVITHQQFSQSYVALFQYIFSWRKNSTSTEMEWADFKPPATVYP